MTKTTIDIQNSTKERLAGYGNLGSTWDSILDELLDHVEKCDTYWSNKI